MFSLQDAAAAVARQEDGLKVVPIDPKTGKPYPIVDPETGKQIDDRVVHLVIAGPDSRRALQAEQEAWRHVFADRDLDEDETITAEEIAAVSTRALAGSVISWDGFTRDGVEVMGCTLDNVLAVFTQVPSIAAQSRVRRGNRANFTES